MAKTITRRWRCSLCNQLMGEVTETGKQIRTCLSCRTKHNVNIYGVKIQDMSNQFEAKAKAKTETTTKEKATKMFASEKRIEDYCARLEAKAQEAKDELIVLLSKTDASIQWVMKWHLEDAQGAEELGVLGSNVRKWVKTGVHWEEALGVVVERTIERVINGCYIEHSTNQMENLLQQANGTGALKFIREAKSLLAQGTKMAGGN